MAVAKFKPTAKSVLNNYSSTPGAVIGMNFYAESLKPVI
jgi:hypothetical protein